MPEKTANLAMHSLETKLKKQTRITDFSLVEYEHILIIRLSMEK